MTPNEFLNQPFILNNKIHDKQIKLECYQIMSRNVSSPGFEEHYSSNRNTTAPFIRYLEKIDVLEREIAEDNKELEKLKVEVGIAIDKIKEAHEQLLLHYRYVMLMSMPEIAVEMHYSLSWTKKLHRRALNSFERRYP